MRPAPAFTGDEHQAISQAAFLLALEAVGFEARPSAVRRTLSARGGPFAALWSISPEDASALEILASPTPAHYSYADFVTYVDYVDDPIKLLAPDPRYAIGTSPFGELDLDLDALMRLRGRQTGKLHALHNNSSHFQGQMMHSVWRWHRAALEEARLAGREVGERCATGREPHHSLYAALVHSAISAHYLEDFFAPGHSVSPRDAYPDYAANNLHDLYNSAGAWLRLDSEVWETRLQPLWQRLRAVADTESCSSCPVRLSAEPGSTGREPAEPLAAALEYRLGICDCETAQLASAFERPQGDLRYFLRGDDDVLDPSAKGVSGDDLPKYHGRAKAQRALMVLVVARAVESVLEEWHRGLAESLGGGAGPCCPSVDPPTVASGPDVLDAYEWHRMRLVRSNILGWHRVDLPRGGFTFGTYEPGPREGVHVSSGFMGLLEATWSGFLEGEQEGGLGRLGFEWVPAWIPPGLRVEGEYLPKYYQLAFGLGVAHRFDEVLEGRELSLRQYILWPKIDMQASAGVRIARFDEVSSTHIVPELRFAKTFGMLGLMMGASYDLRPDGKGGLDRSVAVESGVVIAVPWWRISRALIDLGDDQPSCCRQAP